MTNYITLIVAIGIDPFGNAWAFIRYNANRLVHNATPASPNILHAMV